MGPHRLAPGKTKPETSIVTGRTKWRYEELNRDVCGVLEAQVQSKQWRDSDRVVYTQVLQSGSLEKDWDHFKGSPTEEDGGVFINGPAKPVIQFDSASGSV